MYELRAMPKIAARTILSHDTEIQNITKDIANARDVFISRTRLHVSVGTQGALKLKEISIYLHAEGYASGEMKHAP